MYCEAADVMYKKSQSNFQNLKKFEETFSSIAKYCELDGPISVQGR